jgi:hypothetical protein
MLPSLAARLLLALLLLQQLLPCALLLLVAVAQRTQRRLAVAVQIICSRIVRVCLIVRAAAAAMPVFPITAAAAAGQGLPSTAWPSTARPATTTHQRLLNAFAQQLFVHFVTRLLLPLPAAAAALAATAWRCTL